MKYKIGIFGSAIDESSKIMEIAKILGQTLALHYDSIALLFGACPGVPFAVVKAAKDAISSIEIWGYSSEINQQNQRKQNPDDDLSLYARLQYLPDDFENAKDLNVRRKYRNVVLTSNCDAGIVVSGRWGSLNEFTNMYDMGKVIGVLTRTGGAADELERLMGKIHKPGKALVFFDSSPNILIADILSACNKRSRDT